MLSRFYLISERNGRTDIFAISISRVSVCRFVETRFAIFTTPLFDGFLRFSVVTPQPTQLSYCITHRDAANIKGDVTLCVSCHPDYSVIQPDRCGWSSAS